MAAKAEAAKRRTKDRELAIERAREPLVKQLVVSGMTAVGNVLLYRYGVESMKEEAPLWLRGLFGKDSLKRAEASGGMPVLCVSSEGRRVFIPLTEMSEDALNCFQDAMNEAIETVRPEVQQADKEVKDAINDDSTPTDPRLYQQVPQRHESDGSVVLYVQGVQRRFEPDDGVGGDESGSES